MIEINLTPSVPVVLNDAPVELAVLVRFNVLPQGARPRRPLNLSLVIDRSGSMGGSKLEQAQAAACHALELMTPQDRLSVLAFDDQVDVVVPATQVVDKAAIAARIRALTPGGSTALAAGWAAGRDQVRAGLSTTSLNRVILISDGQANVGETSVDAIASMVRSAELMGVTTSTLGLGDDYQEQLMEAIALGGDGNFWHVDSAHEFESIFAAELQGLMALAGRKASLGINTAAGVSVVEVLNDFERLPNGRWKLPNLVAGRPLSVVLRLVVASQPVEQSLLSLRLAYDSPESGKRLTQRVSLTLPAVPAARAGEFPPSAAVLEVVALLELARLRQRASELLRAGNRAGAREALQTILARLQALPATREVAAELARAQELMALLEQGEYSLVHKKSIDFNHQRRRSS